MMELDIISIASVDEHGKRESVADAKGHGFSAAHERHNGRLLFVQKLVPPRLMAEDMLYWRLFET